MSSYGRSCCSTPIRDTGIGSGIPGKVGITRVVTRSRGTTLGPRVIWIPDGSIPGLGVGSGGRCVSTWINRSSTIGGLCISITTQSCSAPGVVSITMRSNRLISCIEKISKLTTEVMRLNVRTSVDGSIY